MSESGRAVILLYHRVADPVSDPWELAVTEEQFAEHLEVIAGLGRVATLAEIAAAAADGTLEGLAFAITFDDGYADNLHAARPALEAHGAPATVFVATDCIGGGRFWWDELAELMLESDGLPGEVEVEVGGRRHTWQPAELGARRTYEEVWALLQPLEDAERDAAMDSVRAQLGGAASGGGRSLTVAELEQLASGGLVEIGAHTKTHPVLLSLPRSTAQEEIVGSKAWLEDVLDRRVTSFSYPFGGPAHYGEREVELVREAGFERACSAMPGVTAPGDDVHELSRVAVGKWDGDALATRLAKLIR